MDIIYLRDIACNCVIGVWPWEKKVSQLIKIDLDLGTDFSVPAKSDNLDDAVNYQRVTECVVNLAESSRYDLMEALAEDIAQTVLKEFDVRWIKVKIDKGSAVKNVKNVGVVIERQV